MKNVVIISAADTGFFSLLKGMVRSVLDKRPSPISFYVLDLGLSDTEKEWLGEHEVSTVRPGWDYQGYEFPGEWFKAMTARPNLPKWIPGFDTYLWIDADTWIQDWSAVSRLLEGVAKTGVAAVPEDHAAYPRTIGPTPDRHGTGQFDIWHAEVVQELFGREMRRKIGLLPLINSGVFGAAADSRLWAAWDYAMQVALKNARRHQFYTEQTAFNVALRMGGVAFAALPSWCNWICNRAWPVVQDDGVLAEPIQPYRPLGIIHMAGETKKEQFRLPRQNGGYVVRSLTYPG